VAVPTDAATTLLAELDPLAYPRRIAVLAERALSLAGTPALDDLLAGLNRADGQRQTALFLAIVAGHLRPSRRPYTAETPV